MRRSITTAIAAAVLCGAVSGLTGAQQQRSVVVLDRADLLHKQIADSFLIVSGNVRFIKDGMVMLCDSAHYSAQTGSFQAFGNVSMTQGDTLYIYADELDYDAPGQVAWLYADPGRVVRMINRDVTLETDIFKYDVAYDIGSFNTGGVLYDTDNRLTSVEGEYIPALKDANFYIDVHLHSLGRNDTLDIYSDSLFYNSATGIARVQSPSEILNYRGIIYTSQGVYDTKTDTAVLYRRSLITTPQGRSLTADTILYDRVVGTSQCYGSVWASDSAHSSSLRSDYAYFHQPTDSVYATGRLLIKSYPPGEDTLYVHAGQLMVRRVIEANSMHIPATDSLDVDRDSIWNDTTRTVHLWPRVRIYRTDLQGICDSICVTRSDSTMRMYRHPVLWNDAQQIFGGRIDLHLNDSTVDRATLPEYAFVAQRVWGEYYNQLAGKLMEATFADKKLRTLDINGNVEMIMYPEESDSTFNKLVTAESSFLTARFHENAAEYIKMWPETPGTVTPLFMVRRSQLYLPKFHWYEGLRPTSPYDVMNVPEAMEQLMQSDNDGRP